MYDYLHVLDVLGEGAAHGLVQEPALVAGWDTHADAHQAAALRKILSGTTSL